MKSHYDVLGIPPTATAAEIKSAFRKKLLECHPDRNPGDPSAGNKTMALNKAYEILGNAERRAQYDRTLKRSLLEQMLKMGIIKAHPTDYGITVYCLTVPHKVRLPHQQINEMKKSFRPAREVGGLFCFGTAKNRFGQSVLVMKLIMQLKNISSRPSEEFVADIGELSMAINNATARNLVPVFFHTYKRGRRKAA